LTSHPTQEDFGNIAAFEWNGEMTTYDDCLGVEGVFVQSRQIPDDDLNKDTAAIIIVSILLSPSSLHAHPSDRGILVSAREKSLVYVSVIPNLLSILFHTN